MVQIKPCTLFRSQVTIVLIIYLLICSLFIFHITVFAKLKPTIICSMCTYKLLLATHLLETSVF